MNYREILGSSKKVVGRKFRQTTKKELLPIWNRLIEKVLDEKIIIYETEENQIQVEVEFNGNTVWLNLNQLATLFGRDKSVISRHLNNVFKNNELDKGSVVAKNVTTASKCLNLDFKKD